MHGGSWASLYVPKAGEEVVNSLDRTWEGWWKRLVEKVRRWGEQNVSLGAIGRESVTS